MTINIEDHAGVKILRLHGELGANEGLTLIEEVTEALEGRGACAVIDMSGVPSISSAGIGAVVRIKAQANTQEQTVLFADPSPFVSGVLVASKLDKFLEIYASVDQALQSLQD
jgi:anti-anti-sigma factor